MRFRRRGGSDAGGVGDEPTSDHGPRTNGTNGTNGAHPLGLSVRRISLAAVAPGPDLPGPDLPGEDENEPVDLVAVQADDELINALAAGLSVSAGGGGDVPDDATGGADDRVSAILAAWKADVDATPIPDLVDVDAGVAAVLAARRPSHRMRHLAPIAAAAAFLVFTLAGVSVGSYSAEPNDVLWPVAKVLYSERTTSVEAADRAEQHIARAKQAIASGRPEIAEKELAAASADLTVVRPEEGKTELAAVQDFLVAKAAETKPGVPTDPGAPLATDHGRTVPPGAAITEPSGSHSQPTSPAAGSSTDPGTPSGETSGPPAPQAPVDPEVAAIVPDAPDPGVGSSTAPTVDSGTPPADATTAPDSGTSSTQPDSSSSSTDPTDSSPAPAPPDAGAADPGPDPLGAANESAAPDAPVTN